MITFLMTSRLRQHYVALDNIWTKFSIFLVKRVLGMVYVKNYETGSENYSVLLKRK